uniref:Uncharacterized protein n=1 Tax=Hyaloperonospora arabidopsidis (strain Emoy2) TaxID=559515 RepID=M4B390_HYAAE
MAVLDPRPVEGASERGVSPRACCAPSHQLWARTAQERCKRTLYPYLTVK